MTVFERILRAFAQAFKACLDHAACAVLEICDDPDDFDENFGAFWPGCMLANELIRWWASIAPVAHSRLPSATKMYVAPHSLLALMPGTLAEKTEQLKEMHIDCDKETWDMFGLVLSFACSHSDAEETGNADILNYGEEIDLTDLR